MEGGKDSERWEGQWRAVMTMKSERRARITAESEKDSVERESSDCILKPKEQQFKFANYNCRRISLNLPATMGIVAYLGLRAFPFLMC
jgi:hypothetical protein